MLAANLSLKFCPRRESAAIRRKVQSVSGESFANILSAADKKIKDGKHFIFCQSSAANTRSLSLYGASVDRVERMLGPYGVRQMKEADLCDRNK